MASVYKLPIALEALRQVDAGALSLDDSVTVHPRDFVAGANPFVSRAHGRPVTASVGRLLAYMLTESDNTASDALLRAVGGPRAVRRRMAELGAGGVDVSRSEAEIFAAARAAGDGFPDASDPRDTASAEALAELLATVHEGAGLTVRSRLFLTVHLAGTSLGDARIRGLLPPDTPVAHKTGTHGPVTNDIGIVVLPDGTQAALAVLTRGGKESSVSERERTIARIARLVYDAWTAKELPAAAAERTPRTRRASGGAVRRSRPGWRPPLRPVGAPGRSTRRR